MKLGLSLAAGVLSMLAFTLSREGYVGVSDPPLMVFGPVWLLYALGLAALWFLFFYARQARVHRAGGSGAFVRRGQLFCDRAVCV